MNANLDAPIHREKGESSVKVDNFIKSSRKDDDSSGLYSRMQKQ